VIKISGSTSDPKLGEWAAVRRLVENGLGHAVLPGFRDDSTTVDPPRPAAPR
jgi:hypothetical protein